MKRLLTALVASLTAVLMAACATSTAPAANREIKTDSDQTDADRRAGIRLVDVGNLLRATDQNGIVVITQIKPIYVMFTLPQQSLAAVQKAKRDGAARVLALVQFLAAFEDRLEQHGRRTRLRDELGDALLDLLDRPRLVELADERAFCLHCKPSDTDGRNENVFWITSGHPMT